MSSNPQTEPLQGLVTARGLAVGPVFIYQGDGELSIPEYVVQPGAEGDELLRFRRAIFESKRDLEEMIAALRTRTGRTDVKVFECHMMLVEDVVLAGETEKYILEDRVNAEAAVRRTASHAREIFGQMNDPYFRERVRDLEDVERRLLKKLMGLQANTHAELKRPSIIVADDLTPTETVQLPREFVLGFATNRGSTTSHVALLARSMGLPAITGLGDITARVKPGETVLLDGAKGLVYVNPGEELVDRFRARLRHQTNRMEVARSTRPAGSLRTGGEVLLLANLHPGAPLDGVAESGARGIGLYRSEYLWLNDDAEPSEEKQFEAYREVAELARTLSPQATAVIRVLDIGGDKMMRGVSMRAETSAREPNPFLGNRSIRYLLSNPDVFKTQLRAILRASAYGRVSILYPMISCLEEVRAANRQVREVQEELESQSIPFAKDILRGAMIEVPSAALNVEAILPEVDFLSIGTNDLVQYTLAADRGNEAVSHLYQPTNPAILHLIRHVLTAAKKAKVRVEVCGESASDPVLGLLWVAMGADALSMSPAYIPLLSKLLSKLSRQELKAYAKLAGAKGVWATSREIYEACRDFLRAHISDWDTLLQ